MLATALRLVALLGFALPTVPLAQTTLVVDGAERPGFTHTSVQAAIEAAPEGALILIRWGTYDETLLVSGKSLTLQAEEPGTSIRSLYIRDLAASQPLRVRGLGIGTGGGFRLLDVKRTDGSIWLEDVDFGWGITHVEDARELVALRCSWDTRWRVDLSTTGVTVTRSRLRLIGSSAVLRGGVSGGGGRGFDLLDAELEVHGGLLDGPFAGLALLRGSSRLATTADTVLDGAVTVEGGVVETLAGDPRGIKATSPVSVDGSFVVTAEGRPGDRLWVLLGPPFPRDPIFPLGVPPLLATLDVIPMGPLIDAGDGTATLERSIAGQPLPPGTLALRRSAQSFFLTNEGPLLGGATTVTLLDEAYLPETLLPDEPSWTAPLDEVDAEMSLHRFGDLDGDGYDDFLAGPAGGERLYMGSAQGPRTTLPWSLEDLVVPESERRIRGVGDFDGDGLRDLAIQLGPPGSGRLVTVHGTPVGPDTVPRGEWLSTAALPLRFEGLDLGDFDGDGRDDLVVPILEGTRRLALFRGGANGISPVATSEFGHPNPGLSNSVTSIGDVTSDGRDDFVLEALIGPPLAIRSYWFLLFGTPDGLMHIYELDRGIVARFGDTDGDGGAEFLAVTGPGAAPCPGSIGCEGFLPESFGDRLERLVELGPWSPAGDLNGDGRDDLVATGLGRRFAFEGRTGGGLGQVYSSPYGGASLALGGVGDVNGDGRDDLGWILRTEPGDLLLRVDYGR